MITGRQIRDARALLGLQRNLLATRVKVATTTRIARAESVDDEPPITVAQAIAIRAALEAAGIEFENENGAESGVRLRNSAP